MISKFAERGKEDGNGSKRWRHSCPSHERAIAAHGSEAGGQNLLLYHLCLDDVELAVKNVIHNRPVLNRDALWNPEALDYYANLKELQED